MREGKKKEGKGGRMEGKGAEGERSCAPPVANYWLRHCVCDEVGDDKATLTCD